MLRLFGRDRKGATIVEYGLIVAVLSLAMVGGFSMFSDSLQGMFEYQAGIINEKSAPK